MRINLFGCCVCRFAVVEVVAENDHGFSNSVLAVVPAVVPALVNVVIFDEAVDGTRLKEDGRVSS